MVSWKGGIIQFIQLIRVTRCHRVSEFQNSVFDPSKNSIHPFISPESHQDYTWKKLPLMVKFEHSIGQKKKKKLD